MPKARTDINFIPMSRLTTPQLLENAARLHRAGDVPQARALCVEALRREPNRPDLLRLGARLAYEMNDVEQAAEFLRRAIALSPGDYSLRVNLGMVLVAGREFEQAVTVLRDAVAIRPDSPEALANLGAALRQKGDLAEAVEVLHKAAVLSPGNTPVLVNLGAVLTNLERFDDAISTLQTAVAVRPDDELAHYNLAVAYKEAGRLPQALESFRRVTSLRLSNVEAIINTGDVLNQMGEYDQAIDAFNSALAVSPEDPAARTNLSFVLLLKGDYAKAWPLYESRRRLTNPSTARRFNKPEWEGQSLPGKRILVHREQGLGDTLQFIRYAPMVAERGLEVFFLCQRELRRLLTGQCRIAQLFTDDEPLPEFDVHCPLLSLPHIFGTTLQTIPAKVPYIFPDADLQSRWRSRLDPTARLKIGLNWAGSPVPLGNRKRTVGLSALAPLAKIPGAEFYSLQKGPAAAEAAEPPRGMKLVDFSSDLHDFADTAALMWCLDLVITCDTSVAHAAGAMGVKTHVLLPHNPDWRWHLGRTDSPWYPTLTLHRQPAPGDYNTPIRKLARKLAKKTQRR
jgi:Flp pilus assembly protein TadD